MSDDFIETSKLRDAAKLAAASAERRGVRLQHLREDIGEAMGMLRPDLATAVDLVERATALHRLASMADAILQGIRAEGLDLADERDLVSVTLAWIRTSREQRDTLAAAVLEYASRINATDPTGARELRAMVERITPWNKEKS